MIQVEVSHLGAHTIGIREPRVLVFGRVAREGAGFGNRFANRVARHVRRARTAFPRSAVDGDTDAAIVGVLEALHITQPRRRSETDIVADGDLGLVHTAPPRLRERARDDVLELLPPERLRCRDLAHVMLPAGTGSGRPGRVLDFHPDPLHPVRIEQAE